MPCINRSSGKKFLSTRLIGIKVDVHVCRSVQHDTDLCRGVLRRTEKKKESARGRERESRAKGIVAREEIRGSGPVITGWCNFLHPFWLQVCKGIRCLSLAEWWKCNSLEGVFIWSGFLKRKMMAWYSFRILLWIKILRGKSLKIWTLNLNAGLSSMLVPKELEFWWLSLSLSSAMYHASSKHCLG